MVQFINTPDTISCNSISLFRNSTPNTYTFNMDLGSGVGPITINYHANPPCASGELNCGTSFGDPELAVPDKFTVIWNGQSVTSGYRGGSAFNTSLTNKLLELGRPVENISGNGIGSITLNKSSAAPNTATLVVDSPIISARWSVEVLCVGPTPTPTVTSSNTPTPTPTVTRTGTATPTPSITSTVTSTVTPTPSITGTVTSTPTPTVTHTGTATPTPSMTGTVTATPTATPTLTPSPTVTVSPSNNVIIPPHRKLQAPKLSSDLSCGTGIFAGLLGEEFQTLFNNAIDSLLNINALSVPCVLRYANSSQQNNLCNNCIYSAITRSSSGKYLIGGPVPFADGSVCPICAGNGIISNATSEEIVNMMVIFDSKYFMNWSNKNTNIVEGMAQSISCISLLPKLRNASEVIFDKDISALGHYRYERYSDPQPAGLGHNQYIFTMWKRK